VITEHGGEDDPSSEYGSERVQDRLTGTLGVTVRIDVVAQQHQGVEVSAGVLGRHAGHGDLEGGRGVPHVSGDRQAELGRGHLLSRERNDRRRFGTDQAPSSPAEETHHDPSMPWDAVLE
jgi:hypothetical protein